MLLPDNIEQKLGFDKIKLQLKHFCKGDPGRHLISSMAFSSEYQRIAELLDETEEIIKALTSGELLSLEPYQDMQSSLDQARIVNSFLSTEAFFDLKQTLAITGKLLGFFKTKAENYPHWANQAARQVIPKELVQGLSKTISKDGELLDKATPELYALRKDLIKEKQKLNKSLNEALRKAKQQGWTESDSELTIREGRLVIPVQVEHKRRIKGLIHDFSATGKTAFLEPAPALEVNNSIRELKSAEQREIIKILTSLTDQVRPHREALAAAFHFLAKVDFSRAKALWALEMDATRPELSPDPMMQWVQARHPLLVQSHKEQGKPVVPLDIELSSEKKILVISGPNAGGKSVCLKTVGLLQLMLQSGMPVPASESSKAGIFKDILIEIGDEQSIEDDLSTYSSHLQNMRQFLEHSGKQTLFLIDEFGAGTDPQFGGALAKAVLLALYHQNTYGIVTTHYSDLKSLSQEVPGVENGAMRYNIEKLEPLYKLEIGKPGSSFALEIAQKIGLPEDVIKNARQQLGVDQVSLHELLADLNSEKAKYQELLDDIEAKRQSLDNEKMEFDEIRSALSSQKRAIINQAKQEAQVLLDNANQKIETTIRTIKEKGAEKEATKEVRKDLAKFQRSVKPKPNKVKRTPQIQPGPIKSGDWVRIRGTETDGEVTRVQKNTAEVLLGAIKSKIKLSRLDKIPHPNHNQKGQKPGRKGINLHTKMTHFSSELDIRGKRGFEALELLDKTIDQAIMVSCDRLRIIHGKGDGILKDLVRAHLMKDPHIKDIKEAHPQEGGAGVTLVQLI